VSSILKKIVLWIKSNVWLLAAFLVPFAIRWIPELLSWPYLLGYDTLTVVDQIQSGHVLLSGSLVFFHNQLFYSVATLANWAIGDTIITLKIFGPLLMGLVALMMFLYARYGLGWSGFKSFLVSLFVGIYFVSLRNSWDLYSQSFGLIFLFATLIILRYSKSTWRYPIALIFMFLTVMSHQLVSVILFSILGLECIRLLITKDRRTFVFSFIPLVLAGALFLFKTYSPSVGNIVIPSANVTYLSIIDPVLILLAVGLLIYCYGLIVPLAALGLLRLKDWFLKFWFVWCIVAVIALVLCPSLPLYYWNRWVYLLVYPLLFFTVAGLDQIWHLWQSHRVRLKRMVPKTIVVIYIALLLALSGFYLAASPEKQISYFSTANPYLSFIPSSMLQNSLPIKDNPSLVACFNWIKNNTDENSSLITHPAIYDLAKIYISGRPVISVHQNASMITYLGNETAIVDEIINASMEALNAGNSSVYTIWWTNNDGWYKISALPSVFEEVFRSDQMCVYLYDEMKA
jgi:hypothetical protein